MAQDGDAHVAFPLFQQVFDQGVPYGAVSNLSESNSSTLNKTTGKRGKRGSNNNKMGSAWMSQEVSNRLGSVGYNPNIHHL